MANSSQVSDIFFDHFLKFLHNTDVGATAACPSFPFATVEPGGRFGALRWLFSGDLSVLHVLRLSQVSDGFLRLLIPVLRTRHGANIQLLKRQWTETNVMTDLQIVVRFFLLNVC